MIACPPPSAAPRSVGRESVNQPSASTSTPAPGPSLKGNPGPHAIFRRGISAGSLASVLSTTVIAVRSKIDRDNFFCGTNATSHWLWGERAFHQAGASVKYTLVGYLIHHLCSVFWATLFTAWRSWRMRRRASLGQAGTTSDAAEAAEVAPADRRRDLKECLAMGILAATIDYTITPRRFRPGYERHLCRRSLFGVYGAFGAGLALGTCCLDLLARKGGRKSSENQR